MPTPRAYLLILGEREGLAWVLRNSTMAFPSIRRAEVDRLAVGDHLYLITTRSCFHNPARDRTRVIGNATVATAVTTYEQPVTIAGRGFTRGCAIVIQTLAPYLDGLELAPLVPQMAAFPNNQAWPIRLRRPLLELPPIDVELVKTALSDHVKPASEMIPEYLTRIRPVAKQVRSVMP